MNFEYSFIVPVYNRPQEIKELLESFLQMKTDIYYEIVIVEDGSTTSSKSIVEGYKNKLNILYLEKENTGPGDSRNYGMQRANSSYFIVLDSDVLMPAHYLDDVDQFLRENPIDCYGGPDAAHENFTDLQKAINFTMTSMLTTGGIRGRKSQVKSYEPRSFNMGISRKAFEATKGFSTIHPGEDPDLSIRIKNEGFETGFIPEAYVYHKRRISWEKFYIQVTKFGKVRPILNSWHPETASLVFYFPTFFILGFIMSLLLMLFGNGLLLFIYFIYFLLIFTEASINNNSAKVGLLSIVAVFIQFFGYGFGYLRSSYYIGLLNQNPKKAFPELFFE